MQTNCPETCGICRVTTTGLPTTTDSDAARTDVSLHITSSHTTIDPYSSTLVVSVSYVVSTPGMVRVVLQRTSDGATIGSVTADVTDLRGDVSVAVPVRLDFLPLANNKLYRLTASVVGSSAPELTHTIQGISVATATRIGDLERELETGMRSLSFTVRYTVNSSAVVYVGAVLTEEQSENVVGIVNIRLPSTQGVIGVSLSIPGGLTPTDASSTYVLIPTVCLWITLFVSMMLCTNN